MSPDPLSGSRLRRSRAPPLILPLLRHCTIKDQSTDVHGFHQDISGTFMANRNQAAFQKPTAAGRYKTLYGYAEFAPINMVCAPQYSKDDTLMIQIEIHNIP